MCDSKSRGEKCDRGICKKKNLDSLKAAAKNNFANESQLHRKQLTALKVQIVEVFLTLF